MKHPSRDGQLPPPLTADPLLSETELIVRPIGFIRTKMLVKFDAPHQPDQNAAQDNFVELIPEPHFQQALEDLAGFDRIWLVWWFHRNKAWRPRVLPPRGSPRRRGVFSTRSPHRPNPIGISAVPLLGVEGLRLHIGACDLIDGTPFLDIKPYLADADSFPGAARGWLNEVAAELAAAASYTVEFSPVAAEQIEWLLAGWQINFVERAIEILSRDPSPHRTRRITRVAGGLFRMACGAWRLIFSVADRRLRIEYVKPGFPSRSLHSSDYTRIPDRAAQIAFLERWQEEL